MEDIRSICLASRNRDRILWSLGYNRIDGWVHDKGYILTAYHAYTEQILVAYARELVSAASHTPPEAAATASQPSVATVSVHAVPIINPAAAPPSPNSFSGGIGRPAGRARFSFYTIANSLHTITQS